jgi:hypothetical protein
MHQAMPWLTRETLSMPSNEATMNRTKLEKADHGQNIGEGYSIFFYKEAYRPAIHLGLYPHHDEIPVETQIC